MKAQFTLDDRQMVQAIKDAKLTAQAMQEIEYAGSRPLVDIQRTLVPRDTGATMNSIDSHITESSPTRVVDEVGPETEYAPFLEYGTSTNKGGMKPRPYVRPSVADGEGKVYQAITVAFANWLREVWKS